MKFEIFLLAINRDCIGEQRTWSLLKTCAINTNIELSDQKSSIENVRSAYSNGV